MSAKWRQVQAWDREHLRGPLLAPVRLFLAAFSSITLAVVLLLLVVLFGISASVPVGLLALTPSVVVVGLTFLLTVAVGAGVPAWGLTRLMPARGSVVRVAGVLILTLVLMGAAGYGWWYFLWPKLHYDPATKTGVRFFASFVEQYSTVTLRRLPGMEMSELEYYAWWPLRWILLLFVLNMVVSTVRRIEFTFRNLGVLTVHTGIVMMALGSVYYSGLKREGDTVLFAGPVDPQTGSPTVGPPQERFFDNTRVALYAGRGDGSWDLCRLEGVPRYHNYNLGVNLGVSAMETSGRETPWKGPDEGVLNVPCVPLSGGVVDSDLGLRVVGYCYFAEPVKDWIKLEPGVAGASPLRMVYLHSSLPDAQGVVSDKPVFAFTLPPTQPQQRIAENQGAFSVEYTMGDAAGMTGVRWKDLTEALPPGTLHALVVEVPAAGVRQVYPVEQGSQVQVGSTGYSLTVKELRTQPPFPIITKGYENAQSSMAVVTVKPPPLHDEGGETYDRWVYHRFPDINQDMLQELNARGMPKRRDADPAIRISLIEADQLNVYIDEPSPGVTRAAVRRKGGGLNVISAVGADGRLDLGIPNISLRVGERWENAVQVERPAPAGAEEIRKDKEAVGSHEKAMLAVEISSSAAKDRKRVVWLAFNKYFGMGGGAEQKVTLWDGRTLSLAFGRLQHALPGFAIQLADFQMISYDHRGAPRDYQSVLRVTPVGEGPVQFDAFERVTRLNAPLTAPFYWDENRAWVMNFFGRLRSGLSPYQYKFSQAGWDASGWARTQKQADQGMLKKPFASFTILGVGNSPGIHVIALGGILMGMGIPWAFYVKPWLVRREKKRIQEEVRAGKYQPPRGGRKNAPAQPVPEESSQTSEITAGAEP